MLDLHNVLFQAVYHGSLILFSWRHEIVLSSGFFCIAVQERHHDMKVVCNTVTEKDTSQCSCCGLAAFGQQQILASCKDAYWQCL